MSQWPPGRKQRTTLTIKPMFQMIFNFLLVIVLLYSFRPWKRYIVRKIHEERDNDVTWNRRSFLRSLVRACVRKRIVVLLPFSDSRIWALWETILFKEMQFSKLNWVAHGGARSGGARSEGKPQEWICSRNAHGSLNWVTGVCLSTVFHPYIFFRGPKSRNGRKKAKYMCSESWEHWEAKSRLVTSTRRVRSHDWALLIRFKACSTLKRQASIYSGR